MLPAVAASASGGQWCRNALQFLINADGATGTIRTARRNRAVKSACDERVGLEWEIRRTGRFGDGGPIELLGYG
jgi:hypothetical protein